MLTNVPALIIISTILVSLISLIGAVFFAFNHQTLKKLLFLLLSFSVGALLGEVFLHMVPEMLTMQSIAIPWPLLVLIGLILSFILEKFIHWRHCHDDECQEHTHPMGTMNLVGDFFHNALDGILIAGSFTVNIPLGIATTIAVTLHEIPQEISDMGILLYSGFTKKRAIILNLLTGLTAVTAAILVIIFGSFVPQIGEYVVPLAAGNFLYIAGSDLIPELHRENGIRRSGLQLLGILLGIGLMAAFTLLE